jgi:hypothetical protein
MKNFFRRILFFFTRRKVLDPPPEVILLPEATEPGEPEVHIPVEEPADTKNQTEMPSQPFRQTEKLPREFRYVEELIGFRLKEYAGQEADKPVVPQLEYWDLPIADFVKENQLSPDEAIMMVIGIIPYVQPDLYDNAIERNLNKEQESEFPKIGGMRGKNCRFFLPTGETSLFLLGGSSFEERLKLQQLFSSEHFFWERKILWLEDMQHTEPPMHGRLIISPDYVDLLTYGYHKSPQFSISFPAKRITGRKDVNPPSFEQLVISEDLMDQIHELKSWLKYNEQLLNNYGMRHKLRKGYRALFYGPPGTGKTFTAEILGNDLKKDVYKIDLSMVVSKYIGETEKNLEMLFARAEDKGWILFFDEADALFGKRTNVRDAHDKYANQEVSYLLQRIEEYNGLVILATNMKNNIDDAFIRRFNSILRFPFPDAGQRALIWKKSFPENALFFSQPQDGKSLPAAEVPELLKKYELTGANINNVVQYAGIKALQRTDEPDTAPVWQTKPLGIYLSDILDGIRRELVKEGKPFAG